MSLSSGVRFLGVLCAGLLATANASVVNRVSYHELGTGTAGVMSISPQQNSQAYVATEKLVSIQTSNNALQVSPVGDLIEFGETFVGAVAWNLAQDRVYVANTIVSNYSINFVEIQLSTSTRLRSRLYSSTAQISSNKLFFRADTNQLFFADAANAKICALNTNDFQSVACSLKLSGFGSLNTAVFGAGSSSAYNYFEYASITAGAADSVVQIDAKLNAVTSKSLGSLVLGSDVNGYINTNANQLVLLSTKTSPPTIVQLATDLSTVSSTSTQLPNLVDLTSAFSTLNNLGVIISESMSQVSFPLDSIATSAGTSSQAPSTLFSPFAAPLAGSVTIGSSVSSSDSVTLIAVPSPVSNHPVRIIESKVSDLSSTVSTVDLPSTMTRLTKISAFDASTNRLYVVADSSIGTLFISPTTIGDTLSIYAIDALTLRVVDNITLPALVDTTGAAVTGPTVGVLYDLSVGGPLNADSTQSKLYLTLASQSGAGAIIVNIYPQLSVSSRVSIAGTDTNGQYIPVDTIVAVPHLNVAILAGAQGAAIAELNGGTTIADLTAFTASTVYKVNPTATSVSFVGTQTAVSTQYTFQTSVYSTNGNQFTSLATGPVNLAATNGGRPISVAVDVANGRLYALTGASGAGSTLHTATLSDLTQVADLSLPTGYIAASVALDATRGFIYVIPAQASIDTTTYQGKGTPGQVLVYSVPNLSLVDTIDMGAQDLSNVYAVSTNAANTYFVAQTDSAAFLQFSAPEGLPRPAETCTNGVCAIITAPPTTPVPTTPVPTTPVPTTPAPTTPVPTTPAPTTVVPTTVAATTVVPTTAVPTTPVATTPVPTTVTPTTQSTTTQAPTTPVATTTKTPTTSPITSTPTPVATTSTPTTAVPTRAPTTAATATTATPTTTAATTSAPTNDITGGLSASDLSDRTLSLRVTMRFLQDLTSMSSTAQTQFSNSVVSAIAQSTGTDPSQITAGSLSSTAPSTLSSKFRQLDVSQQYTYSQFLINAPASQSQDAAGAVYQNVATQFPSSASKLRTASAMSTVDPTYYPRVSALAAKPSAVVRTSTATSSSSGLSTGALVGIIVGCCVGGLLLITMLALYLCKRKPAKELPPADLPPSRMAGGTFIYEVDDLNMKQAGAEFEAGPKASPNRMLASPNRQAGVTSTAVGGPRVASPRKRAASPRTKASTPVGAVYATQVPVIGSPRNATPRATTPRATTPRNTTPRAAAPSA